MILDSSVQVIIGPSWAVFKAIVEVNCGRDRSIVHLGMTLLTVFHFYLLHDPVRDFNHFYS
jgi:hypothetical protein